MQLVYHVGMKRFQIYLDENHLKICQEYGRQHGIIAVTGAKTGDVDKSAVIRQAIELLLIQTQEKEAQS